MSEEKHRLLTMIDNLIERDRNMLNDMRGFFGHGMTLENRLILADARAQDALLAVSAIAKYIVEAEGKK